MPKGLCVLCGVLLGCAEQAQQPITLPPVVVMAKANGSVVAAAKAQIGRRYVYGAASPKVGFDCSGLMQYIFAKVNINLPRTAKAQAKLGVPVSWDSLQSGDLLVFNGTRHVGVYIDGGRYINASSFSGRVVERTLVRAKLTKARRLIANRPEKVAQ